MYTHLTLKYCEERLFIWKQDFVLISANLDWMLLKGENKEVTLLNMNPRSHHKLVIKSVTVTLLTH